MPINISHVFTVRPGRANRYKISNIDLEIKAIAARELNIFIDDGSEQDIEVSIVDNNIILGTSIIVAKGHNIYIENTAKDDLTGYIGGITL